METNDVLLEEKLLNNALLFNAIRKNNPTEKKIKQVLKYLERGAEVNAVDANIKHNTPLHVAALKGEIEVTKLLLEKGANVGLKNDDKHSPLDIAQLSKEPNCKEVANILKKHYVQHSRQFVKHDTRDDSLCKEQKEVKSQQATKSQCQNSSLQALQPEISGKEKKGKTQNPQRPNTLHHYQKRSGTSGFSGHLYETKLLSLVLLRALHCENMTKFLLATNVDGMGAFDDVVFRYEMNGLQNPKLVFLQAKHRDDPTKDKVTVDEVLKPNGDFSLQKYLESYLQIIERIAPDSTDALFEGSINTVDCDFIIYTSAVENFAKKKVIDHFDGDRFLRIDNNKGMIFQFEYDNTDLELLMNTVARSRAVSLAKVLSKFTLKDNNNYNNMMMDDLMKTFHVFLEQNVISLETAGQDSKSDSSYCVGKFRQTFLTSTDNLLSLMKRTMFNKVAEPKKITSSDQENEIESTMASLSFKLPANFGNVSFCFQGSEAKKQRRLNYLITKIKKLLPKAQNTDSKYTTVKVDDSMIGPGKVLQDTDIEYYRLGGLVGNLFILDDETRMLKFNLNEDNLSEDNLKLLETLRKEFDDLSVFRLDINVRRFPKLSLSYYEHDRVLVKEFLSKLKFYTNQAKESEVEKVVKQEIDLFCTAKQKHDKSFFQIKCDAIFLKVHDKIQKWWQQSARVPYLTESCLFYHKAQEDILHSPVLSILNFIFQENMKKIRVEFSPHVITSLKVDEFLKREERIMVIESNEIHFSSKKLINHFSDANTESKISFINVDLEFIDSYFEVVRSEFKSANIQVLALVCQELANSIQTREKICYIVNEFKGKIIIISSNPNLTKHLANIFPEKYDMVTDRNNNFTDLTDRVRTTILEERNIIFQGEQVPLGIVLNSETLQCFHTTLVRKLIMNEEIRIGKVFSSSCYDDIAEFYMNRSVCRYMFLEYESEKDGCEFTIDFGSSDIIVITMSDLEEYFDKICNEHKDLNVHWFIADANHFVWKRSRGNLESILLKIDRSSHAAYTIQLETLMDIQEKIVIISAEPGMGKSTLLTRLAIQTKHMHPNMWISKINLIEHIHCFSKWKEDSNEINLLHAIKFIYSAIGFSADANDLQHIISGISMDSENNVHLKNNDDRELCQLASFELILFNHLYKSNQVALLFDGFDEICPHYAKEVMQLLNILKTSNVQHLWVTTRSQNVLKQLEMALGTFSYNLEPLSLLQQKHFLQAIWASKLALGDAYSAEIKYCVETFFLFVTILIREKNFTSLPLHLYMISDLFKESFRDYYDPFLPNITDTYIRQAFSHFNLFSVYKMFVDIKFFRIRFGEKKHFMCFKDPDMRKLVDKEYETFFEGHKKIGAFMVLDEKLVNELFTQQDIIDMNKLIEDVKSGQEKTGIVECIVGRQTPKFVHFSFAEYFATEYLFDKLCAGLLTGTFQRNVFDQTLKHGGRGIRRFIASRVVKHKQKCFESHIVSLKGGVGMKPIIISSDEFPLVPEGDNTSSITTEIARPVTLPDSDPDEYDVGHCSDVCWIRLRNRSQTMDTVWATKGTFDVKKRIGRASGISEHWDPSDYTLLATSEEYHIEINFFALMHAITTTNKDNLEENSDFSIGELYINVNSHLYNDNDGDKSVKWSSVLRVYNN